LTTGSHPGSLMSCASAKLNKQTKLYFSLLEVNKLGIHILKGHSGFQ